MRPGLQAKASRQGGLVTRRQAVDAGYRERELRTLTAVNGAWVVVRRGVYVEREIWDEAARRYDGQDRLRDLAAHLSMRSPHLMSHDSAARAWQLPLLRSAVPLSHVTREGVGGSRTEHGVKHHLTRIGLLGTTTVASMPATGLARTVVDVARERGWLAGTVVADAALRARRDCGRSRSRDAGDAELAGHHRGRAACDLADPGADTAGESLSRVLVEGLGLGRPQTQFPIRTTRGVAWVDLLLGCHVIEFDGRQKYRRVEAGGVADRPVEDVLWDERTREHEVCGQGFGMSRITWAELWPPRREAMLARVRAEYGVTLERFGPVPSSEALRFAEQMADERRRRIFGRSNPAA